MAPFKSQHLIAPHKGGIHPYLLADEVIDWQMRGDYPLIVEIPGIQGHLTGRKTMTDAIREAIGIHV